MAETPITLTLSKEQALVLFEWLAGLESSDRAPADQTAEQRVFWDLECQLEKALTEPFDQNYGQLVEEARRRILAAT